LMITALSSSRSSPDIEMPEIVLGVLRRIWRVSFVRVGDSLIGNKPECHKVCVTNGLK